MPDSKAFCNYVDTCIRIGEEKNKYRYSLRNTLKFNGTYIPSLVFHRTL